MYKDQNAYKAYQKKYRQKNKEQNKKYQKEYQKKNREVIKKKVSEYGKKWYQKNKAKKDAQNKEWSKTHKKERVKYVQKYVKKNKEKVVAYSKGYQQTSDGLFRTTKYGAKKKGNEFLLTKEQFEKLISKPCKYCGEIIERRGIDRIDNNLGYTLENSAPCCKMCNYMKRDYKLEEFLNHIKKIARYIA